MVSVSNPDRLDGLPIGTNIAVKYSSSKVFYRILNRDTLFYRDSHTSLSSGSTETFTEITNLNPNTGQILQITNIQLDGNTELSLKQPAATNRWGTQRSPTGGLLLDKFSGVGHGKQVNLWILINYPPNTQLVNNTDVSIATTLWWMGWRYEVEELAQMEGSRLVRGVMPQQYVEVAVGPPGQ